MHQRFCQWRSMTPLIPPMCLVNIETPLILRITLDAPLILPIIIDALVLPTMINARNVTQILPDRSPGERGNVDFVNDDRCNVCIRSTDNDRISSIPSVTIDTSMTVNSTNDGIYKRRRRIANFMHKYRSPRRICR